MSEPFLQLRSVSKSFGGVRALAGVSLDVEQGECHALVGENGAGKSTLGKVLAGIHVPDRGEILLDGRLLTLRGPADAVAAGVGMVHQELAFCPDLSVAENLALGRYPRRLRFLVDRAAMTERAQALLARIGCDLDVSRPMRTLTTGQEQMVQIAAALGTGARILIFDEPTSSLSEGEAERLFELIAGLKAEGVTMIYISHRMPEVFRLCDRITVLRDGERVGTVPAAATGQDQLVRMMIGRPLEEYFPRHLATSSERVLLRVAGLSSPGRFSGVSFELREGEILGCAGLVGAGRSDVATALFGLDRRATGQVELDGRALPLGRPREAMRRGLALVPEDRKRQGLILMMGGRHNYSLATLDRLSRFGLVRRALERREAERSFRELDVRTPSLDAPVAGLSGGNQQKVVLAKWLARDSRVLIADEPTRGVDVGAKAAIHGLLDRLAQRGVGILLISSELPELLHLSTRILVMREGRLAGELSRQQASQESLLRLMAQGSRAG